jgi:hypothetical protein
MKIISGAQTGADQAGLFAARDSGIETGGHMPKGFRTQAGSQPEIAEMFNLIEHSKSGYPPRTKLNATNSDSTLLLTFNSRSPGSVLTRKYAREGGKPLLDIDMNAPIDPVRTAMWIKHGGHKIVNIAGNGDGGPNGVTFDACYNYLMQVFKEYKKL